MKLYTASQKVLHQLSQVISQMNDDGYSRPLASLNNSTIGQHVRHTLEFYLCLIKGLESGIVNYDSRERDHKIESDTSFALNKIEEISDTINRQSKNSGLQLEGSYSEINDDSFFSISSNFERELAYNIEHAVHHMAIIKIGLAETNPALEIPPHFGVAVSTVRYHN